MKTDIIKSVAKTLGVPVVDIPLHAYHPGAQERASTPAYQRAFIRYGIILMALLGMVCGLTSYAFLTALMGETIPVVLAIVNGIASAALFFAFALTNTLGQYLHGPNWYHIPIKHLV